MSKLYNGGASFGFSLNYNTAVPVDTRFVVATLDDLKNPETWVSGTFDSENDTNNVYTIYPGLSVTVNSEKTVFVFVAETVSKDTITSDASWSKLSTAESTGNTQGAIDKVESSVGLSEDGSHIQTSGNYTSKAKTIVEEISALDTTLKTTNDTIGTSNDTKDDPTVFGGIAKVQDGLDVEKSKLSNSATIKVGESSYETALEIKYVPAVTGDDTDSAVAAHIALCDKNGKELSIVNIDSIVGNGTLKSSSYDKNTGVLSLVWNKADGKTTTTQIDLSAMLDINDVLINDNSKSYLDVDLSGGENSQAVFKALIKKVAEATASSTGLADALDVKTFVEESINALSKAATTTDGENIHVTVSETNGIVSIDSVTEDYATITRVAHSADQNASLSVTEEEKLAKGKDIKEVAAYTDDKVAEEAARVDEKIKSLGGTATGSDGDDTTGPKISVKVDSKSGEVSGVTVTTSDIASKAAHEALDTYVKGEKVVGEDGSVTGGIEKRVAVLESKNAAEDFTSSIDKKDASEFVNVVVSEGRDGKLDPTKSSVSVTYASYRPEGEVVTDGVAKGSLVKEIAQDLVNKAVDNLDIDAALEASDTNSHVTVSINQENGKIKDLTVSSSDIASATLLGEKTDNETADTAFGRIAAEAKARKEAIEGLDSEKEATGTNVTIGVKEEDGKITEVTVSESYSTVTRVSKGESTPESLTISDKTGLITGEDLEKSVNYTKDVIDTATKDLSVSASGDSYVSASQSTDNNKKIEVKTNVVNLVDATEGTTGLADSLDVKTSIEAAKKAVEDQIEWIEID